MLLSKDGAEIAAALHDDVTAYCADERITQAEAATRLGVNPSTLNAWLNKHSEPPAFIVVKVMCTFGRYRAFEVMRRLGKFVAGYASVSDVMLALGLASKEAGQAAHVLLKDLEDGHIDDLDTDVSELGDAVDALRTTIAVTIALAKNGRGDGRCATLAETEEWHA